MESKFLKLVSDVYQDSDKVAILTSDGEAQDQFPDNTPRVVLAGSFNPLHAGHRALMRAACERLSMEGVFELSLHNVDKPSLELDELERRVNQFRPQETVLITALPLFLDKIRAFPHFNFVMGADTLSRLVNPTYYSNGSAGVKELADVVAKSKTKLVVGGRVDSAGKFITASDIQLPQNIQPNIVALKESKFREDISSSSILENKGGSE